jgi:outer membrane protein OmpA-like peptidoglycan-associated protein
VSKRILSLLLFCISFTFVYSQGVTLEKARFNTKWEDWGPRLVAGKLYCLSASFDGDSTMNDPYTLKPFSDLYVLVNDTLIQHATFSTHTFGDSTSMSSNFYDGPVSGNDTIMFFTNNHGYEHNVRLGIFYAYKRGNKWIDALYFPFNSLDYNVSHPFYDEKNGKLYFVCDKDSVELNQDIYVCTFDGKTFGPPSKLAQTRSPLNEVTPFVYRDTLYFASNSFGTMGGYDLYKLVDDKVVSLGPDFNSTFDDLGLIYDSDTSGYFTSDRYSLGLDDDIVRFYIKRERPELAQDTTPTAPPITAVLTNEEAIKQLVASKQAVDSLKQEALNAGVSPDIFAFLNLAMAPFQGNLPKQFADKSIPEINAKNAQLQTILALIQQQLDLVEPKVKLIPKAPIANNDLATIPENTPVVIDVLANDSAQVGLLDPKTIDLDPTKPGIQQNLTNPQGTWTVENGKVNFKPAKGFSGPASIPYTVSDQNGTPSNVALISVNVTPVVTPPVANNDQASTTPNRAVVLPIAANDSSPSSQLDLNSIDLDPNTPGQQTTFVNPQGVWSVQNGQLTFTPAPKFTGLAYIPYTIKDVKGLESNVANVTIQVASKQDLANSPTQPNAPIAVNDIAEGKQNTPVSVNVLQNDSDPTGKIDPASVDLDPNTPGVQPRLTTPQGTWSVNNGTVTFKPVPNFVGQATVPYTVKNTDGTPSNMASISVKVAPVVEAPIANNDNASTVAGEPVKIPVCANDIAKGSPLNLATIDLDPTTPGVQTKLTNTQGTWTAANGNVSFVPAPNFVGKASIPYTVKDQKGTPSNVALMTVEVTPKQAAPSSMELAVINDIIDASKIENIHFEFDKYDITAEFKTYLSGLSMLFKANPTWQIELSGHTDSKGTPAYNLNLSKNRAKSAKSFLESCGIAGERITYEFHGLEMPIASNLTPEGRYENRRVEISVFLNGKTLYSTGE